MPSSAVPVGWQWCPLSELARLESGHTPSRRHPEYWGGTIPWISIPDAKKYHGGIVEETEESTNQLGIVNSSARLLPAGTVCLSRTASVGYVVRTAKTMATSQDFVNWTCGEKLVAEFLQYLLIAEGDRLLRFSSGAVHKTIYFPEVKAFHVCVPAVSEQRRIVAILDEAFEGIATAKANAEKSLRNAREVFENSIQLLLSRHGGDWVERTLGEVCEIAAKLVDPRAPECLDLPHIGAGNIESKSGTLVDVRTAREEQLISGKFLFDKSAVLYSKIRPYLMQVVRAPFSGLCSADIYPLVPKPSGIARGYLYYLLLTPSFTEYAIKGSARAGMPKVNRDHLFAYRAWLPSIQEQAQIVAKLDALEAEVERLAEVFRAKLAALDELKKSLLHQAFTGQLMLAKQARTIQHAALQTATPEFTANVIALAYSRHEPQKREKTFGHVKAQKLLHLAESIAKIDLGRQPMKDAAGPNDFQHMLRAEEWAKAHGFFDMIRRGEGYEFRKLSAFDERLSSARQALAPYLQQLASVIDLLVPMDTEEAEIFATVHAAWNNLLIDGAEVTDNAIVSAAREGWHADKLQIPEHKFRNAIGLIRRKGVVPDGTAKYVGGQQKLL